MREIYLDNAASTPLDLRVLRVIKKELETNFGNPGSTHSLGQRSLAVLDTAREKIAAALECDFREIVFTGSATEANNLTLRGIVGAAKRGKDGVPRIIISAIEHESVLQTAEDLKRTGVEVIYLPVNSKGEISLDSLQKALTLETVLVSVMHGNNETGVLEPITKISEMLKEYRKEHKTIYPLLHTDAAQTFQFLDCAPKNLGVDLMTLSAHKIYGPKGVGALFIKQGSPIEPILSGGGQEFGLRSGTENVPSIAGFAEAVDIAIKERDKRAVHALKMREIFLKGISAIKGAKVHKGGLPHILNFYLPNTDAGDMLAALDLEGLALSSGSACSARAFAPSHVLSAMGISEKESRGSLRASFGANTAPAEIAQALRILKKVYGRMKSG